MTPHARAQRFPWRVFGVVCALQLAFGLLTFGRFPPVADGTFYHGFAERLAAGQGYTFAWPDGAVTYAAHYPVGYPALLSGLYWLFGPRFGLAWVLGAALHLGACAALVSLTPNARGRRFVVLAHGLHPALFFYTPALMTESITANLIVLAVFVWLRGPRSATLAGLLFGVATLVRPQSILIALGLAAYALLKQRAWRPALLLAALPFLVCAPWTLRNCERMKSCALVSVNGGWNLLIGANTDSGAWQALSAPIACREVWDEAAKDSCFGREARREIVAEPGSWLARMPKKAQVTFDYFGAAPYTLHAANDALVSERGKTVLGVLETGWQRVLWILAALAFVRRGQRLQTGIALGAALCALWPHGPALTVLGLSASALWQALRQPADEGVCFASVGLALGSTLALHVVFFGGGRYGLVVVPWVVWLVGSWVGQGKAAWSLPSLQGSSSSPANG